MQVVAAGEQPAVDAVETPSGQPAAARSPLAALRGARERLDATLHLDLVVPRWEQVLDGRRLWVRYRPVDPTQFLTAIEKRQKQAQRDPQWRVKAHADALVAACVAVYDLPADVEQPPADLDLTDCPTFGSEDLSDVIGAPASAVETCRRVYATDGDLMAAVDQLLEWSGRAAPKAEADFLTG